MFKSFYPSKRKLSAYTINYKKLYDKGARCLIFDIDNTLVCHGAPQNDKSLKLLKELETIGYTIVFLSNNKEPRVKSFADPVGAMYIYKASKPSKKNYIKAIEMAGATVDTTVFIGDQLFTDIYGANRSGIYSILTNPIDKHEEIQIVLKRILEKIVLFTYEHKLKKGTIKEIEYGKECNK